MSAGIQSARLPLKPDDAEVTTMPNDHDQATSLFITGRRDAHGVEHQALALTDLGRKSVARRAAGDTANH